MAGEVNYGLVNPAVTDYAGQEQKTLSNQKSRLEIGEIQRAIEEQNKLNEYIRSGADLSSAEGRNKLLNYGKVGMGYSKALNEQDKSAAEAQKLRNDVKAQSLEFVYQGARNMAANPSNENIIAWAQDSILNNHADRTRVESEVRQILAMSIPERQKYLSSLGAKAKDMIDQYMVSATDRARLAQSESHFQQRLAQETATGALTPETLDMAANVYLKTGQMPPLGMGKAATALRQSVLNRAAQIGSQGANGATVAPADIAGNIVTAKQDVGAQFKAVKDFSTGVQGRQVNAFNTAIDHLSTMDKLSDALQNGDTKAINAIANTVASQTGSAAPTNFNAAKQIVTAEVIKAVVASGGGVTERQEAERNFAAASSPAQLKGVINTYKQLLGGQLNSLGLQYEVNTGRKDFDKKLTGEAKQEFTKVRQAHSNAAPVTIKSDAEYNALPPGAIFVGPDGQQRRKP